MTFNSKNIGLFSALFLTLSGGNLFASGNEGVVNFAMRTGTWFDPYTDNPTSTQEAWLRSHFWRMQSTSPYFNSRLSWFPNAWDYLDLYGIPTDSALVGAHPDWILKDSGGHFLYIPFACTGSVCSQYAADPGNAAFRSYWISNASADLTVGYKGLWIDDVNLAFRVGNGAGTQVAPVDPRTGKTMTLTAWEQYVADFTKDIRTSLPSTEIVHNSIWFAGVNSEAYNDPSVIEEIQQANYIWCERGVSDPGLTGGTGFWSLNNFFTYVDHVHSLGKNTIFGEYTTNGEFGLAGYFLTSNGGDAEGDQSMTPNNWWAGYEVNLGSATNSRYTWNTLLRRDFSGGMVLMNLPSAATVTVTLPHSFTRISGSTVSQVTLSAGQGAVLIDPTAPAATSIQIDAGGAASGTFSADKDYSGGYAGSTSNTVSTSGVTNPAPEAVYQSERWGAFTYTIPNLTAGTQYTVRLHFAELHWTAKGQRLFNVAINGTSVLSKFDVFATAGGANKALVEQFTVKANSSGQIAIVFTLGTADYPAINGIEVQ